MRRIDRRILIVFSLVFILGLSYGLMRYLISLKEEPPARRDFESMRYVNASVVEYSTIVSPVFEPGRMSSVAEINLSAEASGKIEQGDIPLKAGATFRKDNVLFTIYKDEAVLALKAKKSQFLNSLATLLPDISIDFPEYEEIFRSFFSSIDLDRPLPEFPESDNEKLTIFLASNNILSEYYDIRKDELQLSRHTIYAPFDGTFTEVFLEAGAFTNTGGTVAKAIRTDALELEVPLSRDDAVWVNVGDPVLIQSEKRSDTWNGKVLRKSQVVDENTQSQRVYVGVTNHHAQSVLAGEYLIASFPGRPIDNAMEIPRNAVFNTNEVFTVKNHRLVKQQIHIIKVNTSTLVFNGLIEGDTIVTQPLINVFEGTKVTTSLEKVSAPEQSESENPAKGNSKKNKQRKS